jgi:signal transduction histidine kinase
MRNYILLFFFSGFAFLLSLLTDYYSVITYDYDKLNNKVQKVFVNRESNARALLRETHENFSAHEESLLNNIEWIEHLKSLYESEGEVVVISQADSLVFLSNSSLPVKVNNLPLFRSGTVKMDNGWYFFISDRYRDYTIQVFTLIKNEFRYKNLFLTNSFHDDFNIPASLQIADNAASEGLVIYDSNNNYAFTLTTPDPSVPLSYTIQGLKYLSIILFILSILFVLGIIINYSARLFNKGSPIIGLFFCFLSLLFLRSVLFYFRFPGYIFESPLFMADYYATNIWVPSLGDLWLNVFLFSIFSVFLFLKTRFLESKASKISIYSYIILSVIIIALTAYLIIYTIKDLVINSDLELNVEFIFNIDIYHLIGFSIITMLLFIYFFISATALNFVRIHYKYIDNRNPILVILLTAFFVSITMKFLTEDFFFIWVFIFWSVFLVFLIKETAGFSLSKILLTLFLFGLVTTYALHSFNKLKELSKRQNVSLRISSEQDPVAEYMFHQLQDKLWEDYRLNQIIIDEPYNETHILDYLRSEYFNDFWNKYDIQITVCYPGEILFFKPFEQEMVCDDFFSFYISEFGKPTLSDQFFYLDNNTGRNSYLTIVPIESAENKQILYNLYIEFESRFIPRELGFPELLVDEKIDISKNLDNYSYAIYKNGIMTHKFGKYNYGIRIENYGIEQDEIFSFFESNGFSHLMYNRDVDTKIIVSKPVDTLLEKIAPFTYLIISFLLFIIPIWLIINILENKIRFTFNFKTRIQLAVIGIVLIAVMAVGGASAWFIFNIYKNKNEGIINEKAHSVLIELENLLSQELSLNYEYEDYLKQILVDLSQVFFTDINIFDTKGYLLASSRSKVFEEGLTAPIVDPVAFYMLNVKGRSLFIHNERIGKLEYISAYVPLRNMRGDLIAYINLPYFAQQSELRNEISYFLVAFVNIYLLLLLLSVVIALVISNHVTKPLQIIRDSISKFSIGKTNEKIHWSRKDEIGQLISEYNRMIDELAISAELLARSERETAWREMAKQVAHEIKNPLTPMRLSVQYLERAWKDKAQDWDQRLERFTKTMVEQIDNLSLIAGEFSDFAKMPVANNEIIDLSSFIPEILDLYKDFENLEINYLFDSKGKRPDIYADRKQLLRVFNNLVKNAMQAYPKNEKARIDIKCEVEDDFIKTEISDFGRGIDDDFKKNIFQPYFTTKTAGMGLGLAMVKSIIESFKGHISFESEKGRGTSFIIRIPLTKRKA